MLLAAAPHEVPEAEISIRCVFQTGGIRWRYLRAPERKLHHELFKNRLKPEQTG